MSLNQPIQCRTRAIASAFVVFSCAGPLGAAATFSSASPPGARPVPASQRAEFQSLLGAGARFSSLPLRFELNLGQTDPQVRFLSDTPSGQVFLTSGEIVLRVHPGRSGEANKAEARRSASDSAVIRLTILGPNPNARVVGVDPLPGQTNYFLGNDPGKWRTNVPSFRRVKYENIYSGIDLIYYGTQERLEYDFEVSPGADPNQIALSVAGADGVIVDGAGDLVLRTAFGEIRQCAPHIFQQDGAGRREIAGGYVMHRDDTIAFSVASYDASKKLVIDPEFVFSTYFGGTAEDDIHAITVDSAVSVYVAGATYAHDFPTKNPVQATNLHSQSLSAFVTKFSPDGRSLVYSTYLGGSDMFAVDVAVGIVLDSTGAAYVTGAAGSSDFPTKNPIPGVGNGLLVTKLSADGSSLVYSSVLGGSGLDNPRGIVLDSSHNAYIFGDTQSTDFPTVNPTQAPPGGGGYRDGFWSIISADGSQLLFSTYVGGNNDDDVRQVHVFPQSGDVWIAGTTQSSNFAGNSTGSPGLYQGYFTRSSPMASLRMETQGPITFHSDPLIDLVTFLIALPEGSFGKEVLLLLLALPGWALQGTAVNPATEPFATQQSTDMEVFVRGSCAIVPPATTCSGQASVFIEDAKTLTLTSAVNIAAHVPLADAVTRDS